MKNSYWATLRWCLLLIGLLCSGKKSRLSRQERIQVLADLAKKAHYSIDLERYKTDEN